MKGGNHEFDETGRKVSKEQEKVNKKVKYYMIQLGLIPDDKTAAEEAEAAKVKEINTESPYKDRKRGKVKFYELPEVRAARIRNFRMDVVKQRTITDKEIAQYTKYKEEDEEINKKFDRNSESSLSDKDFEREKSPYISYREADGRSSDAENYQDLDDE